MSGAGRAAAAGCVAIALTAGCTHEPRGAERRIQFVDLHGDTVNAPANIRLAGRIDAFYGPESVRYDSAQDIYFVSNMLGAGSAKDGEGFIARIRASDLQPLDVFIEGGVRGATLNAPKGMVLQGDTLWVTDIDVVRGFHRVTGAPLRTIDLAALKPQMLNDIAVSPDGTLYITDTGIAMTDKGVLHPGGDKVIGIRPGGTTTVRTNAGEIGWPNGVAWDAHGGRWIVVSFDPFRSTVSALSPHGGAPVEIAHGKGRYDGVEVLADGTMLVTCWNDQSLHMIKPDGSDVRLIGNVFTAADIGVDTRRNRVAIPLASRGRVEVWDLPGAQ
jgi:DNA-binding beta-propeller fold protein YncE